MGRGNMTISKVMGVTTYSAVMNVADTDIANVMGVAQGGGGGATLLEGFEATPLTGLYSTWSAIDVGGGAPTVARTTSNVTQGTYSWRVNGITANGFGAIQSTFFDITPYIAAPTQFLIDVFVQTIAVTDSISFQVTDGTNTEIVDSSPGQTGAFTLTLPIGTISDLTNISVGIIAWGGVGYVPLSGNYDYYIDNLRAS